jgi:hypothetical protein
MGGGIIEERMGSSDKESGVSTRTDILFDFGL